MPCYRNALLLLLALSAASCGDRSSSVTDDLGALNALGGSSRSNDFSRFGGTSITNLRPVVFDRIDGGLLAPPLAVARDREILLAENRTIAEVMRDSLLWLYRFPEGEYPLPPVAADSAGTIYSVSTRGMLRALSTGGAERWNHPLVERPDTNAFIAYVPPLAMAEGVIVGASDGTLARYSESGEVVWRTRRGAAVGTPIAGSSAIGIVVALTHNDYSQTDTIAALDPLTGAERWSNALSGVRILTGPAIVGDLIVVGAASLQKDGRRTPLVVALTADGREAWRTPLLIMPHGLAGDPEGNVYVSGSGAGQEFAGGAVESFDHDGTSRWQATFESGIPAAVAVGEDYIYFVARRNGRTGLYTYTHDGTFNAFISISMFPDVLAQIVLSPFGDIVLAGLDRPVLLEGGD